MTTEKIAQIESLFRDLNNYKNVSITDAKTINCVRNPVIVRYFKMFHKKFMDANAEFFVKLKNQLFDDVKEKKYTLSEARQLITCIDYFGKENHKFVGYNTRHAIPCKETNSLYQEYITLYSYITKHKEISTRIETFLYDEIIKLLDIKIQYVNTKNHDDFLDRCGFTLDTDSNIWIKKIKNIRLEITTEHDILTTKVFIDDVEKAKYVERCISLYLGFYETIRMFDFYDRSITLLIYMLSNSKESRDISLSNQLKESCIDEREREK